MRLQGGKCTCRTCTSPHKPLRDPNYTTKHLSPFTSLCLTLSSLTEAVPAFTSFYRICRMVIVLARLLPVFTSFCGVLNLLAKPLPAFMSFWGMPTALAETPAFHEHLCIYAHLSNTNCTLPNLYMPFSLPSPFLDKHYTLSNIYQPSPAFGEWKLHFTSCLHLL